MCAKSAIPVDQLAAFLAEPTPRRFIPPQIRRAANRQAASLFLGVFGVLFGSFGLIFVWIFTPWNFLQDLQLKEAPSITGRVESVTEANMTINDVKVMCYAFSFQPPSSRRLQGECFTTGTLWKAGDEVRVRYLQKNPTISSIEGARRSQGSVAVLFVWIFPLVGFGMVAWVVTARRRMNALLERGAVTEAIVTDVKPTSTSINKQRVHAITLERAGAAPLVVRRHQPDIVAFAHQRLESKQPVFVLYDPARPKRTLLPETL